MERRVRGGKRGGGRNQAIERLGIFGETKQVCISFNKSCQPESESELFTDYTSKDYHSPEPKPGLENCQNDKLFVNQQIICPFTNLTICKRTNNCP